MLIKEHKAELIENVEDILKNFKDCSLPLIFKPEKKSLFPIEKAEEELLQKMPIQEISVEDLALIFICLLQN